MTDCGLRLPLRCPSCGGEAEHEVHRLFVNPKCIGARPFVGDALPCPHCGERGDFTVTAEGRERIAGEYLRVVAARSRGRDRPSALVFVELRLFDRRLLAPGEALDLLRPRLESVAPRGIDGLDLARCWICLERPGDAIEALVWALAHDPGLVEASLDLATLLEGQERGPEALACLTESLALQESWRFHRLPDGDPEAFGQTFARSFNRLRRHAEKAHRPPALHPAFLAPRYRRIGRNASCPCGSGKRFRLCCGRPSHALKA